MNRTRELLKASHERLEGLIGEVKELRYKVKDVSGEIDSLRSSLKEGLQDEKDEQQDDPEQQGQREGEGGNDGGERLTKIEERLDYLVQKWLELDQEIFKLKKKPRH